jgi:hypothetical protein
VQDVRNKLKGIQLEEHNLIRPDNPTLHKWDIVMILAILFSAVVTPFEVAFIETKFDALFIVNRIVDALFVVDMYIQFHLMYYDEDHKMVKHRGRIAHKYLTAWFIIDLVAIFPFDQMKYVMPESSSVADQAQQMKVCVLALLSVRFGALIVR